MVKELELGDVVVIKGFENVQKMTIGSFTDGTAKTIANVLYFDSQNVLHKEQISCSILKRF